jgi:hypothetical protein
MSFFTIAAMAVSTIALTGCKSTTTTVAPKLSTAEQKAAAEEAAGKQADKPAEEKAAPVVADAKPAK